MNRNNKDFLSFQETHLEELKTKTRNLYTELLSSIKTDIYITPFDSRIEKLGNYLLDVLHTKEDIFKLKEPNLKNQPTKEESKQSLIREINNIKEILLDYKKIIEDLNKETIFYRLINKLEFNKAYVGFKLERLNNTLQAFLKEPDLTDNEIDIYLSDIKGDTFKGTIFLHNSPITIGSIEYRGSTKNSSIGDIGYYIDIEYRGNNYAYKALCLIKEKLLKSNITKVVITTNHDNIASQRIIEKFGGRKVPFKTPDIYCYECDLSLELTNEIPKTNHV